MCELLALSSRFPTSVTSSLATFAQHRSSGDGWGVAFYDGGDVRLYKEPEPAADSVWLDAIQQRRLSGALILAHIRHATRGGRALANTQPFSRELGGRIHVFAHNGRLDTIDRDYAGNWSRCRPVGETDSEIAFCILLERMAPLWARGIPALEDRVAVFARFAADMRALGPANFLYSDGDALFVHGHRRMQGNGTIAPPGLWRLARRCACDPDTPASERFGTGGVQEVMLFASVPLTDEAWIPLGEGEVFAVRDGRPCGAAGASAGDRRVDRQPAGAASSVAPAAVASQPCAEA